MSGEFLPYGRQFIDDDDIAAVEAVLRGDFLTTGPTVEAFESALAERVGARFAVACASGTAALHMAMAALHLGDDDTVAVPSITFLATANAARYVGAEVEFVDVNPTNGLATPDTFSAALRGSGRRPNTLLPVHLAGQCVDMPELAKIARNRGLRIVEDAAHALGSTYEDESGETVAVGSCRHSDMTIFSFHPVKTIAMGEGGIVTTNDETLFDELLRFRNHGMTRRARDFANSEMALAIDGLPNPWYYEMPSLGFNYRASDIHCALGLSQLRKLDLFASRRRELVAAYDEAIAKLSPFVRPIERRPNNRPCWHLYPVLVDFKEVAPDRATLMRRLREKGIGTQVHYIPVHHQPYYRGRYGDRSLPGAESYYADTLSLPLHYCMKDSDTERIVRLLEEALHDNG